jgi:hypothetical protein
MGAPLVVELRQPSDVPVPFLRGSPALVFFYGLKRRFRSIWMGVVATSVAGAARPRHERLPQLAMRTTRPDPRSQQVASAANGARWS